jgi:hypothetical protein
MSEVPKMWGYFVVGLALVGSPAPCHGQKSESLREAFLTQAPQAWAEYRKWSNALQGSSNFRVEEETKDTPRRKILETRNEFKQRDGSILLVEKSVTEEGKPTEHVEVSVENPKYGFRLRKAAEDKPWVVVQYEPGLKFVGMLAPRAWVGDELGFPVTFRGFRVASTQIKFEYPSREPGFKLLNVSAIARDGREWVKVEFVFDPGDKADLVALRGGWVVYDPTSHWVQHECALDCAVSGTEGKDLSATCTVRFEYKDGKPGFPILKRMVMHRECKAKGYIEDSTMEWSMEETEAPESAFALSAFGLPDPMGMELPVQPSRWYLWFIGAAIASIVAGAVLWRQAARRKAVTNT